MSLTLDQIAALRELDEVWPESDAVIIGATALGFYYDMTWRKTADVDLVLALDLAAFPGALVKRSGWNQHPTKEHEFTSPRGQKIDLLPVSRELVATGILGWPSGHVMNVSGMDLAFEHAERRDAGDGYIASVAPPPVVTVLKMAAFGDRPAERLRDLSDIAHLLDHYVESASDRRWDEANGQDYELAPAYLLGLDIGRVARAPVHFKLVQGFLELVGDPDSVRHSDMRREGPSGWQNREDALERRLEAFASGIRAASAESTA
jgi:predicted nucleotidyltransferase